MRVALFPTCIVDAVAVDTGVATVRLLERLGHEVVVPERTTCCGQPAWNAGHAEPAAEVARTTLHALDATDAEVIVLPAGSCATMVRVFWQELFHLAGDARDTAAVRRVVPRVRELSEFLAGDGAPAGLPIERPEPRPTVYHRSCHMLRELGIAEEPEGLLDQAATDRRVPEGQGRCCGFGGLFSVKLPEVSVAMADEVLDAAVATGAERVVGCDASCLMHLEGRAQRRELPLEFEHLADALERTTREAR
ncbi:(Fe-S)-binding protein [Nitriliruptoraceae bacterium ZYF776]|nr:(Fe-S)-binding protein [Profundirhabdus halotolerans]